MLTEAVSGHEACRVPGWLLGGGGPTLSEGACLKDELRVFTALRAVRSGEGVCQLRTPGRRCDSAEEFTRSLAVTVEAC